ncbi:hypothetical protein [Oscillatoria sp. HE19RPO]|nr:hypothetical protein [Oscillatoria sp. HE19RPO]
MLIGTLSPQGRSPPGSRASHTLGDRPCGRVQLESGGTADVKTRVF